MMTAVQLSVQERAGPAFGAVLVQVAIACAFLWGMGADVRSVAEAPLRLFDILPPPPEAERPPTRPPPRVESDTRRRRFTPREEGGSSPPNLRSQATPVVAPEPIVQLPVTPPIVSAPVAGTGSDPTQGAADVRGPGTGSGGLGDGTGSGYGGGGPGGGGYGDYTPPRQIRGTLADADYPAGLGESGVGGTVGVIFTVLASGRVTDCRIRSSSGNAELDRTTCRLIERRFVFEPSRDGRGRPVDSRVVENHSWIVEDLPPERPPPRRRRGW